MRGSSAIRSRESHQRLPARNLLQGGTGGVASDRMEALSAIVRRNEVETMLQNARLTRDWPDGDEQRGEAERQVRMAMYRSALGQISDEERERILTILRPCCPEICVSAAPVDREWELPPADA